MTAMVVHPLDIAVIIAYFVVIVGAGIWVGKFTKTTFDFFLAGQRFSWWLAAFSCVATLVGSYSFIQYSQVGYQYGFTSLGPYMNEWFILPIFLCVWLPIIYFSRVQSIPEYFEKRFDARTRYLVLFILMIYLIGYIGINLLTIGVGLKGIFGWNFNFLWNMNGFIDWNLVIPATVLAILSGLYLHQGGQTAVIITDLLQGVGLLLVGLLVVGLGLYQLGGFTPFWEGLPVGHKLPFPPFNDPPEMNFVGDFWNDAMVGTFAFYCINQGVLMRFLSVKSVHEGRKAMLFVVVILMPLAAIAVGGAGWIGRVLVTQGKLPESSTKEIFVQTARYLCVPGIFGFVISAMIAALMSTLDTLISAVSAIAVNDICRPLWPNREDKFYLNLAKQVALGCTLLGIFLIPIFDQFNSIYEAISYFTSAVTPPLAIVIACGTLSHRFDSFAAFWTLVLGSMAMALSIWFPELVTPFAHGTSPASGYSYIRALYGLSVCSVLALSLTLFRKTKPTHAKELVVDGIEEAKKAFKGGEVNHNSSRMSEPLGVTLSSLSDSLVRLPKQWMENVGARPGDLIYVCDSRPWLGGLRSAHLKAGVPLEESSQVELPKDIYETSTLKPNNPVRVQLTF